jgi:hypothetical protein
MANLRIVGVDGQVSGTTFEAQATAKDIVVDRSATWRRQKSGGPADLDYVDSGPTTMTFEVLLGGVDAAAPVQPSIAGLRQFTDVDATLKRPPKVRVAFGPAKGAGAMPPFDAVIETCSVRYLAFDGDGVALQAMATIRCREAGKLAVAHSE